MCYMKPNLSYILDLHFFYWECISINNFTVSGQQKCYDAIVDVAKKVGGTCTVSPCVPIILLRSAYLYRSISGGKVLQVSRENRATMFEKLQMPQSVWKRTCESIFLQKVMKMEKKVKERQKKKK